MKALFSVCVLLLAQTSSAQEVEKSPAPPSLELSLKAGGHFPQLVSKLGTSFDGALKVGYAPFAGRQLQLFLDLGYSQPAHTTTATDPRLQTSGADYSSTLTVADLHTTLGLSYFFTDPSGHFLPYAGLGFRAHFLRADVVGLGGADFGKNTETATRFGGTVFAGAGFKLGPGMLLGELNFAYVPVWEKVTGPSNVGSLGVLLGYGVLL